MRVIGYNPIPHSVNLNTVLDPIQKYYFLYYQ